jgi:hypothetical protein
LPRSYQDVIDAVEDLTTSKHDYKTVVIDTVDALEALMHRAVCKKHSKPSIEAFGYGKGYNVATDEWRLLLDQLNRLVATGVDVVLLGHSHVKAYKNPTGEDYDRFQLRMHEKVASATKEWCDAVGFLRYEEGGAKLLGDDSLNARARGYSTKSRILSFDRDAAWDAKSRLPLPASITIDAQHPWRPLQAAIAASELITDDDLRTAIESELQRIGDIIITPSKSRIEVATVRADVAKGDRSLLARTLNFLRGIESQSTETETVTDEGNQ